MKWWFSNGSKKHGSNHYWLHLARARLASTPVTQTYFKIYSRRNTKPNISIMLVKSQHRGVLRETFCLLCPSLSHNMFRMYLLNPPLYASAKRGMEKGTAHFTKSNIRNLLNSCGSHAHHHPSEIWPSVYWFGAYRAWWLCVLPANLGNLPQEKPGLSATLMITMIIIVLLSLSVWLLLISIIVIIIVLGSAEDDGLHKVRDVEVEEELRQERRGDLICVYIYIYRERESEL